MRRIGSFGVDDAMMIASLPVPRHVSIIFLDTKQDFPTKRKERNAQRRKPSWLSLSIVLMHTWMVLDAKRRLPGKAQRKGRMETSSRDVKLSSFSEVRREERDSARRNTPKRTEGRHRRERSWLMEMMFGCET
eukprot:scaffold69037_cov38-Cyclotella_meneghiniana.AAC.2